jgi:hypothetical protein
MTTEPGTITEKQGAFIIKLLAQKDLTPLHVIEVSELNESQLAWLVSHKDEDGHNQLARLSKDAASKIIENLLKLNDKPIKVTTENNTTTSNSSNNSNTGPVPDAGYYFIDDPTRTDPDNGTVGVPSFFRVQKGKKDTNWEGYTFLAIQASDYFHAIKDPKRREIIFAEILKDPIASMNQYGLRLGRCGVCNRTLTDRHSILKGIGPICAARLDSTPSQEDIDVLKQLGLLNSED